MTNAELVSSLGQKEKAVTDTEPVIAFSTSNYAEAEILKSMLESDGIRCELEGEHQASLTGLLDIHGLVRAWDRGRAERLLSQHAPRHVQTWAKRTINKKIRQSTDLPVRPTY
jgi:hypothetical protein